MRPSSYMDLSELALVENSQTAAPVAEVSVVLHHLHIADTFMHCERGGKHKCQNIHTTNPLVCLKIKTQPLLGGVDERGCDNGHIV